MTADNTARVLDALNRMGAASEPCKCMNNHASVAPTHAGHCCFWPPDTDCHQAEFAAWVEEHKRCHPGWVPS